MQRSGSLKKLEKAIKPYGLKIVRGDHHHIVDKRGVFIHTLPSSPSCPFFAENTIHELVRRGILPAEMKNLRIRG